MGRIIMCGSFKGGAGKFVTTYIQEMLCRQSVPDLNIRTGPSTDYSRTGKFIGVGTFTIVEVKEGKGVSEEWGRLKISAGRIALSPGKKL